MMRTMDRKPWETAVALADHVTSTWNPKMKWMWGEALLGYALFRLDEYRKTDRYTAFLTAYCGYYVAHPPIVDQSDTAAPGLITYAMQKKTGDPRYAALTSKVVDYIKKTPRILEDSVNHLGTGLLGKLYPQSIWVDSLMMFSVFPAWYASLENDPELLQIAARQPRVMAKYLMDSKDHLWYHSYWVRQKTHYPRRPIYWGRGNGWVIASLPMIWELIRENPERASIAELLRATSEALLPYQRPDGTFETVINRPGKTYRELSFTALVASGWMQGYRLGLLGERFRDAGVRAFMAVTSAVQISKDAVLMPEISGPTIPLAVFPYWGYKGVPRKANWSYGIAALLFAAVEYHRLCEKDQ